MTFALGGGWGEGGPQKADTIVKEGCVDSTLYIRTDCMQTSGRGSKVLNILQTSYVYDPFLRLSREMIHLGFNRADAYNSSSSDGVWTSISVLALVPFLAIVILENLV